MSETATATAGTTTNPEAAENAQGEPQKTTPPVVPPAAQKATSDAQGTESDADKIARLEREVASARQEAGKSRVNAKDKAAQEAREQVTKEIAKALGLTSEGDDADPVKLQQQIAEHQQAVKERDQELAVYRSAGEHGADPNRLLDSRKFLASIKDLDPTDSDAISAAIKAAVGADETLKSSQPKAQAAKASGTATTGGSGEGAVTPEQFKAMGYAERVQLFQSNRALYDQLSGRS